MQIPTSKPSSSTVSTFATGPPNTVRTYGQALAALDSVLGDGQPSKASLQSFVIAMRERERGENRYENWLSTEPAFPELEDHLRWAIHSTLKFLVDKVVVDLRRKGLEIGAPDPNSPGPHRDYDACHARGFRVQGLRAATFGAP